MAPLAEPAIAAVRRRPSCASSPERWIGVYLHWMENIRDWCITRQLWWGHRIPVWYCDACGDTTVARDRPDRVRALRQRADSRRTPTCSTPGSARGCGRSRRWAGRTTRRRCARFYPTDTLVTGTDIIFFWVARMMMAGYEFMGECAVPRRVLQQHRARRAGPEDVEVARQLARPARRHRPTTAPTPALRDRLARAAGPGRALRVEKTELGRHFANKIWNAARFVLMNLGDERRSRAASMPARELCRLPERWILSRLQAVDRRRARSAFAAYRFNDAALALYQFVWDEFCDWYLELAKLALYGADAAPKAARAGACWCTVLDAGPAPAAPVHAVRHRGDLAGAAGRRADRLDHDRAVSAGRSMRWRDAAAESARRRSSSRRSRGVRNIRSELGIPPSERPMHIAADGRGDRSRRSKPYIKVLAKVSAVELLGERSRVRTASRRRWSTGFGEMFVALRGVVDPDERAQTPGARSRQRSTRSSPASTPSSRRPDFVDKAPADVVEKERQKAAALRERQATLQRHLAARG